MSNDFQDEMLAAMAHDLRNPMNTILTGAAVLESQGQPDSARISKMIMRAVRRMDELVGDMLDLSHLDRGLTIDKQLTPLQPLLEDALQVARDGAGVKIIDATVAAQVEGKVDPLRIGPAVVRLLVLALGFSPPAGRVQFSAIADAGTLLLRVRDSGPGLAPEKVPQIFDLHFTREPRGYCERAASITIAIVRGIVHAHGGTMLADSAPGQGVTFSLTLPI